MSEIPYPRLTTAVIVAVALMPVMQPSAGAQAPKGDLWETKSQMSMEGMPMAMPAQTNKVCSAKEWNQPPSGQKNCTSSNMRVTGNKVTWDVKCTGPTMNGVGEILRESVDAYSGTIKFTTDQGNMNIKLSGRKIGECDNPQ